MKRFVAVFLACLLALAVGCSSPESSSEARPAIEGDVFDQIANGQKPTEAHTTDADVQETSHAASARQSERPSSEGSETARNEAEGKASSLRIDAEVGDYFVFGSYEQDNDLSNGKEAIEWIVLDKKDTGDYLLLSHYGLDSMDYHTIFEPVTWERSNIRKWLNTDFLDAAFTADERSSIVTSFVPAEDNTEYGTDAGNDTYDKIFLLSIDEAERYFANDDPPSSVAKYIAMSEDGTSSISRACYPTEYAISRNAVTYEPLETYIEFDDTFKGCCIWWLRSPGTVSQYAADVGWIGNIWIFGMEVYHYGYTRRAVRPALWVHSDH